MITLITGAPGTGKTAWLINEVLELRKTEPNKLLFIHGIRNLRGIQHETIFCNSQLCDICRAQTIPENAKFVENWPSWKQSDSLIIVDEVQRIWRPRTGGSQPSEAVSGLETHRHYGLDFWLISQGPHLFDNFIRLLVGRHVHLVARWSGRTQYEYPECKQDVTSRTDAVSRPYKLPLHVYKHYDSAEVHTKTDKRKPLSFYAVIFALILALVMGFFVVKKVSNRLNPDAKTEQNTQAGGGGSPPPPVQGINNLIVPVSTFPNYTPQIESLPESAPAYAHLIKVESVPNLMGCVSTPTVCKCYTSQGTPYQTSKPFCQAYLRGEYFNPYRSAKKDQEIKPNDSINLATK